MKNVKINYYQYNVQVMVLNVLHYKNVLVMMKKVV